MDTTWKFRDMIAFRDNVVSKYGLKLLTHTNPAGANGEITPFTHGSAKYTDLMKTDALKQALDLHGFDAAFGGARRDEEKSRAKERVYSFRDKTTAGTRKPAPGAVECLQQPGEQGRIHPRVPAVQLD